MTAVALPGARLPRARVASPDESALRRLIPVELPAWAARQARQPNTWTAGLVLTLAATLAWHHAIARSVGAESDVAPLATVPVTQLVTPAEPDRVLASVAAAAAAAVKPLPTHAPVDPFRSLIAADGSVRAQQPISLPGHHRTSSHAHGTADASSNAPTGAVHSTAAGNAGSCANPYVVRTGDSLWAIAAGAKTTWRAVYTANRATIGPDPGLLIAGQHLCLPGH